MFKKLLKKLGSESETDEDKALFAALKKNGYEIEKYKKGENYKKSGAAYRLNGKGDDGANICFRLKKNDEGDYELFGLDGPEGISSREKACSFGNLEKEGYTIDRDSSKPWLTIRRKSKENS